MKFAKDNFLHFDGRMNNILVRENKCFYSAFTLAEMMVVMLILSIIMAAMAPVMTTRNKLDQSAPWSWATNGSDAYYGLGDAQVAMIGQEEVKPTDDGARFIINSPSSLNHILFKNGDTTNGRLNMSNSNVFLGSTATGQTIGSYSVGLGGNIAPSGTGSVSVGYANKSTADYSFAGGYNNAVSGLNSIAIGKSNIAREQDSIVLGRSNTVNGQDSIILGRNNEVNSNNSIGIGLGVKSGEYSIAIGDGADAYGRSTVENATGNTSIAIGYQPQVTENNSIAIGSQAIVSEESSIAIGNGAKTSSKSSIVIGQGAEGTSYGAIAIGHKAKALFSSLAEAPIAIGRNALSKGMNSIAIGSSSYLDWDEASTEALEGNSIAIGMGAKAKRSSNIAIGVNACKYATGFHVTCIGAHSGPQSSGETANLQNESNMMFLGTESTTVFIPGNLIVGSNVYLNSKGTGAILLRPTNDRQSPMELRANYGHYGEEPADNLREFPTDVTHSEYNFFNKFGPQPSDRRLKYVGSESTSGLDKIRQLKVFNYTFKKDKKKVPHVGVIAQDLQKVFPNAVKKGVDGFLTIRMEDMFYAMINAIKELDLRYRAQEKRIDELEARIQKLEAKLK